MNPLICVNCNIPMVRRKSKFKNTYWWGCPNFPKCDVKCNEHPDGTIMSLPADRETRELRMTAHLLAEVIWGDWKTDCNKVKMYNWMAENTRTGHIGTTNKTELPDLIKKLKLKIKKKINDSKFI